MHAAEGGSVSRVSTFNCRFDILQDETICVGEFSNGGDRSVIRGWLSGVQNSFYYNDNWDNGFGKG